MTKSPAVVLLSGGLDSTTVAAMAIRDGFEPHALSFSYGQRHGVEIEAAKTVVKRLGIEHHVVVQIDLRVFGGSALTSEIEVPHYSESDSLAEDIPVTYVPARNTIFLSFALAFAETISASDIFLGINALDYSGYPDCRPEYLRAYEAMANLATKASVQDGVKMTLHAPLIAMTKAEIITCGLALGVDYSITHSCYDPDGNGQPCNSCDSCILRRRGFEALGLTDPVFGSETDSQRGVG